MKYPRTLLIVAATSFIACAASAQPAPDMAMKPKVMHHHMMHHHMMMHHHHHHHMMMKKPMMEKKPM
jgi:Spy/CpxP family protein refolding chaperone